MRSAASRAGRAAASAVGALALAAAGAAGAAGAETLEGRCSLRIEASATLHAFSGEAPCALFRIEPIAGSERQRARVEVAVDRITTGIAARDARMREMFDAEAHPVIAARFDAIEVASLRRAALREGPAEELAFLLRIGERERRVVPSLARYREGADGSAAFRASFEVSLADFGLEAPTALGFVRVADRVGVEAEVELRGLAAPAPEGEPAPRRD